MLSLFATCRPASTNSTAPCSQRATPKRKGTARPRPSPSIQPYARNAFLATLRLDPAIRGLSVISNLAALLNLHYHERHIVTLWLAVRKIGHFGQNAFNDFPWCHSAAGLQQSLK